MLHWSSFCDRIHGIGVRRWMEYQQSWIAENPTRLPRIHMAPRWFRALVMARQVAFVASGVFLNRRATHLSPHTKHRPNQTKNIPLVEISLTLKLVRYALKFINSTMLNQQSYKLSV